MNLTPIFIFDPSKKPIRTTILKKAQNHKDRRTGRRKQRYKTLEIGKQVGEW